MHIQEKLEAAVLLVKQAFNECPSYGELIQGMLSGPLHELSSRCTLLPGRPVQPMLAKPEKSIEKVMQQILSTTITTELLYCAAHSDL
jgi:DNA ligase 1